MKHSLLTLSVACAFAAAATAQVKQPGTPKVPQHGYIAPPTGAQLLVVGGSDDCANAFAADNISGPGTFAVTNVGATNGGPDAAAPCVNTQLDVWFYWTSTQNGTARVQFCGQTASDTVITVWPDDAATACPTGAASVACNDDSCGLQSLVTFPATNGQTFFFQLGAFGPTTTYAANFVVDYVPPPPPPSQDSCATPELISGAGPHNFNNTLSTTGVEGQTEAACLFFSTTAIHNDGWFTWTPTMTGTATLATCGTTTPAGADTKVAIYDGNTCPTAAAIACNDDACGLNSSVTWNTVCGQPYLIQLGRYPGSTAAILGTFTITEVGTPCSPPIVTFCVGDGTLTDHTTPCPCANNGTAGNGCANSANPAGANLTTTGNPGTDDVVLVGSGMPLTVSCIYLQGDATDDIVFGDGVRCTGGTLIRLRTKANVGGASMFPDSTDTITLSQRGGVTPGSGAIRYYQTYYRNSAPAFCPPETFNVTNGRIVTW
jgi:hypothetical protein